MTSTPDPSKLRIELGLTQLSRPGAHELHVRPSSQRLSTRLELATLVLKSGVESLEQGEGPIERILVPGNPTLDDLLAASFARRLLLGQDLPAGLDVFARYAALAREGLRPGRVAQEESLEGLFQALLNASPGPLTNPSAASRFLSDWERLFQSILAAASSKADPFTTPLFSEGAEFARELAFLRHDRQAYEQDVLRGERWVIHMPGGPRRASALILYSPKSLLFKHWSRVDPRTPTGHGDLFLGVLWDSASWVFSTDPIQRLSLLPLAQRLQAAEADLDPKHAAEHSWFDGARFDHSLIEAPTTGTRLDKKQVLSVVRRWARARAPTTTRGRVLRQGALAAAVLAIAVAIPSWRSESGPDFTRRGRLAPGQVIEHLRSNGTELPGFAVIVAVGRSSYGKPLNAACPEAVKVYRMLRDLYHFEPGNMRLLLDQPEAAIEDDGTPLRLPLGQTIVTPTLSNVLAANTAVAKLTREYFRGERTQFVFYYAGHGDVPEPGKEMGYLVLSSYAEEPDKHPGMKGIEMGGLPSALSREMRSTHQLVLLDSCFSGYATVARGDPLFNPSAVYEAWGDRARVVITAATTEQFALEEGFRSCFTGALLDALGASDGQLRADHNQDGIVTDAELAVYLQQQVKARSTNRQHPVYFRGLDQDKGLDGIGQYLFVPQKRPAATS